MACRLLSNIYIVLGGEKTVFWSLAVEEQFYLFWPFLIAFTPRRYLLFATLAVVAGELAWKVGAYVLDVRRSWRHEPATRCLKTVDRYTNTLLPGNLEAIGLGCVLAIACYRNGKTNQFQWYSNSAVRGFTLAAWTSLGLAILSWIALGEDSSVRYFTNDLLMAVFYMWVLSHVRLSSSGRR